MTLKQMPDNSVTDKVTVLFRRIIESPSIKQKNQIKPTMRLLKKIYKRVRGTDSESKQVVQHCLKHPQV